MKKPHTKMPLILTVLILSTFGCTRSIRTAEDVTPGHEQAKLDWRYGAADIRIQTSHITQQLMDRWFVKTGYACEEAKPRIVITEIDNCTDRYIPTEMIREILEGVAINDGRYTIVVGNSRDEGELDYLMDKNCGAIKYQNESRLLPCRATAPEFLGKVRLTKAVRSDRFYDFEDYRMSITLYDIESQEAVDSAWDVLSKKVRR